MLATATVVALGDGVHAGEEPVFAATNGLPRAAGLPLVAVMPLGASVGALALAAIALVARRLRLAVALAGAWALGRAASTVLKAVVDRPRPTLLLDDVARRQAQPFDQAFPSAHTTIAVALAVVVGGALPRWRVPVVVLAVAVAAARMYVGVHLPLDLVGGAALGLLAGIGVAAALDRWWPVPPSDPTPGDHDAREAGSEPG
ncbi:phosphatase PAP2 family protein [Iamia majanohamensis]|uniref:Phosphatase PAP2 family protein n=1 Tax=Iamia majanohamensis TaxID=467976 RepID=A0AAE9YH77_9ACTN|nr:phosphatase PAP2 family protein [Iamia majanohamensis]WCO67721.1 phosphatase PAP2 family protein [Iamia majanohamensis]